MDLVSLSLSLSFSLCALRPSPRPSHPINSPHLSPRPPVPPSTPSHVPLSRPVSGCLDPPLGCYYIYLYIYIHVYTYSNLIKGVKAEISSELVSSKLVEFLATLGRKNPLFPFFSPFLASFVVFFWLGGERGERSRSNFRGEWSRVTTLYTCARVVISVWREKEICTQLWLYSF